MAMGIFLLALMIGESHLNVSQLWTAHDGLAQQVILQLRLPHAINAFVVGGLLALAGTLLQVLLRNPLADPFVLGISGGAAVGNCLAMILGLSFLLQTTAAFLGAIIVMLLVFFISFCARQFSTTRMLLSGVLIAAWCGGIVSLFLTISKETQLRGMLFWLMGDLNSTTISWLGLIILVVGLIMLLVFAKGINCLALGELKAKSLGVNTRSLTLLLFFWSSLFSAMAVTIAGTIGFIGLIIPHIARLFFGSDHRLLLPAALLLGGTFLLLADILSRVIFLPEQIPVGIVMVFIGVPVFLWLCQRITR